MLSSEPGERLQQQGEIGWGGAVVDVGQAEGEAAADDSRGDEGDAGLLEAEEELAVEGVEIGVRAGVAETDDVEGRGGEEFEVWVSLHGGGEPAGVLDVPADDAGEVVDAESAEGDPDFERVEAAR